MSNKTRRILFFLTITIFAFANTSQARYLLVKVVGEPRIDDILPGVLPVNLTRNRNIPESDDGSTTPEINGEFKTSTPQCTEDDETCAPVTDFRSSGTNL